MSFTYLGLKAKLETVEVTQEEVDRYLLRLQQNAPRLTPVTGRAAKLGDELVLDYAGFCDGEQFAGGTAEKQTLELGSHRFIPGFEEQLVGANVGDDVTVRVTFPEEYHAEELAGKEAEFRCHVHAIRIRSSYELDDTFAREVGGVDTLEDMKQKLFAELREYYAARSEAELQDKLLRKAAATVEDVFTEEEKAAAIEAQMNMLQAQLAQKGLNLDAYCQFSGQTAEQIRADAEPEAMERLRMQRAVEKIVELEKLEATEEEIAQQLGAICRENNMTMDQLKEYYNEEFAEAVNRSVLTYKAMAFLREHAQVSEE